MLSGQLVYEVHQIVTNQSVINQKCCRYVTEIAVTLTNSTCLATVLWKKFNGREPANLDVWKFVDCSVHLCDDRVLAVLVFLTELIPDRCQLLAVATPRSICNQL